MWQFNDKSIAKALVEAAQRGVTVTIITDDLVAEDPDSAIPYLQNKITNDSLSNLTVILDTKSKSAIDLTKLSSGFNPFVHEHAMIVDDIILQFGSNNWTQWGFIKR